MKIIHNDSSPGDSDSSARSGSNPEDLELARKTASGDREAAEQLTLRLFDHVRSTISYLSAGPDSEDLAQVSLINILKSAHSYRGECSIEYWADKIATRTFFKHYRKHRHRKMLEDNTWVPETLGTCTEEETETLLTRQNLAVALGKLPIKQRTAMVLHYLQGYAIKEVAKITGVPVNTVRGRLRSGRQLLEKIIMADSYLRELTLGRVL